MREGRVSQRVDIELPGKFCFAGKANTWIDADVMNISLNGFCFRTNARYTDALNAKPVIQLGFGLTEEEDVVLDIQVVWAGKTGTKNCLVGGAILNPSGPDYQKILDFYTQLFKARS